MPVRLGVLVPSGNPTVEPELYRMAPPTVTLHFARLAAGPGVPGAGDGMERRILGYLYALPSAARALADVRPAAMVLAHTAVSYLTGFEREDPLLAQLKELGRRAPATTAARAILSALTHLGVRRLALATPYPDTIAAAARVYWEAAGLEVVKHRRLEGAANIYEETVERVQALARAADTSQAEAVLISGTGLPAADAIVPLERALGKPVVTSQSAMLWWALRAAGVPGPVRDWGKLLAS